MRGPHVISGHEFRSCSDVTFIVPQMLPSVCLRAAVRMCTCLDCDRRCLQQNLSDDRLRSVLLARWNLCGQAKLPVCSRTDTIRDGS